MVATIVTSPDIADLNAIQLGEIKSRIADTGAQLAGTKWLRDEIAVDVFFKGIDQGTAESALSPLNAKYDIAIQPEEGRLKKLLLADMDCTMITMESLDTLADELGFGDEVREITDRGMRGELDFDASLRTRVALLKGTAANALNLVLGQIEYMPGAEIAIKTMVAHGAYTALVSGGFTFTTDVVYRKLGFHEHHANSLLIEDNKLTGFAGEPVFGPTAKLDNFNRLCAEKEICPYDTCAIGDGANDIPMLEAAGLGIAYYGKPIVREKAAFQINHSDLTTLLFYQGVSFDNFSRS